nr:sugar O-acetyltransferase [Mariprofundus erugo]
MRDVLTEGMRLSAAGATEFDHMIAGLPFNPLDADLRHLREQARLACARFGSHPSPGNMRHIKRLFRRLGSAMIEPGFQCDYGVNIEVGENFYANFYCVLLDSAAITIGDDVLLGPGVHIYTVNHPKDADERRRGVCYARPVRIGNQVWVGGGAKLLPGVSVGDGAIIGANAVVTRDVEAGAIYY